eukprot:11763186-Karenia_brevis.AAC.1
MGKEDGKEGVCSHNSVNAPLSSSIGVKTAVGDKRGGEAKPTRKVTDEVHAQVIEAFGPIFIV